LLGKGQKGIAKKKKEKVGTGRRWGGFERGKELRKTQKKKKGDGRREGGNLVHVGLT